MSRDREYFGSSFFNKKINVVLLIIIIIGSIVGISITATSFESIDVTEYGIKQNIITRQIEESVYEEGFYYTSPVATFIRFPRTWQSVEFSPSETAQDVVVATRTEDGLDLQIDISFQYRLVKGTLISLYKEYGIFYETTLLKIARGVIRDVAGEYDALEFFYNRSTISAAMVYALQAKESVLYIQVGEFQLRNIDLPDSFEDAIEQVEVAKQEIKKAEYQQQAATIRARTLVIEAEAQFNITKIEAEAYAEALDIKLTAEGEALAELMTDLGFNSTEILTYLWIKAIEEHDESYLIIGDNAPNIILNWDQPTNSTST